MSLTDLIFHLLRLIHLPHLPPNHSKWECKYHVVYIPKCRRRTSYAQLRRNRGEVIRRLSGTEGMHDRGRAFIADHVHRTISVRRNTPWRGGRLALM